MAEHQTLAAGDLEAWMAKVAAALDLPVDFSADIPAVLDLARDVAHGFARPAAPLTTFLVGYAVALHGGDEATVNRIFNVVTALVAEAADSAAAPDSPASPR